jgi:H+/Cl- antiporter ClcA
MRKLVLLAAVIGVADALLFVAFEWVVNHGTDWIWNDVVDTDTHRWRVLVLAPALGAAYALLLRVLRQPRLVPIETDMLAEATPHDPSAASIGLIVVVGVVSLLAGASLGPEASLVAACAGIGAWVAARGAAGSAGQGSPVLVLASVGGLLVAFLGSLVPVVVPLLVLYKQTKKLTVAAVLPILTAGVAAYLTLWVVEGRGDGYGSAPVTSDLRLRDYLLALGVGAVAAVVGAALHRLVRDLAPIAEQIDARLGWLVAGLVFGGVIGLLYLIGGQSEEFSGNEGSHLLASGAVTYSGAALAGLVIVKLVVTGWSLATGYRGGLVFPSIYAGVALGLCAVKLAGDVSGPGIVVGAMVGILTAMGGAAMAVVLVIAVIPAKLLGVALAGAVGAAVTRRVLARSPSPAPGD